MGCMSCGGNKTPMPKTQRSATQTVKPTKRVAGSGSSPFGSPSVRMSFSSKNRR